MDALKFFIPLAISLAALGVAIWAQVNAHKARQFTKAEALRGHVKLVDAGSAIGQIKLKNDGNGTARITLVRLWIDTDVPVGEYEAWTSVEPLTIDSMDTQVISIPSDTRGGVALVYHRPDADPEAKISKLTVRIEPEVPLQAL